MQNTFNTQAYKDGYIHSSISNGIEKFSAQLDTEIKHLPTATGCKRWITKQLTARPITWFAVITELSGYEFHRGREYATDSNGVLRHIDVHNDGKYYAVTHHYGKALKSLAERTAADIGGTVLSVHSKYMFNNSDVRRTLNRTRL